MPEQEHIKVKPVVEAGSSAKERVARAAGGVAYAELAATSNFSFLRGGSHPEELVAAAAESGCRYVAVTDLHTVAGIVRGHAAAKEMGMGFVVGCRVVAGVWSSAFRRFDEDRLVHSKPPEGGTPNVEMLLYPTTRAAYGRMCRMLTVGKRRAAKGECRLMLEDVLAASEGMLAVLVVPGETLPDGRVSDKRVSEGGEDFWAAARKVREVFDDDRLSLAAACLYDGHDAARLGRLAAWGKWLGVPLVATNDVHYHAAERRPLQDVLTCIRLGCTVHEAGFALFANAERHIKGPVEMARLFREYPEAIKRTMEIAERAAGRVGSR